MILTYWGPAFKKGASQFCFDFQQGRSAPMKRRCTHLS